METDAISFGVTHRFSDAEVVGLTRMAVFGGAFKVLNRLLLEFWYCSALVGRDDQERHE